MVYKSLGTSKISSPMSSSFLILYSYRVAALPETSGVHNNETGGFETIRGRKKKKPGHPCLNFKEGVNFPLHPVRGGGTFDCNLN